MRIVTTLVRINGCHPRALACAAFVAAFLGSGVARAQNFDSVLLGGRTATMGGAATAAGNDSAMPYLNPAGLAGLPGDVLGVSADVHAYTRRTFGGSFFFSGGPPPFGRALVTQDKVSASAELDFPTSLVFARQLSPQGASVRHTVALSLITPMSQKTEISAGFNAKFPATDNGIEQSSTVQSSESHQYIGPSYAVQIGQALRLGVSAFFVLRHALLSVQSNANVAMSEGAEVIATSRQHSVTATGWSFAPILGMQVRLTRRLFVGLGVAPPSIAIPFGDDYIENSDAALSDADPRTGRPRDTSTASTAQGHYRVALPMRIGAGVAYENPSGLSLAVDAKFYGPRHDAIHADIVRQTLVSQSGQVGRDFATSLARQVNFRPIINLAAGAELTVTKGVGVRVGAFTDLATSASPSQWTIEDAYTVRENRFGFTAGVGFKFGAFETTVGLFYAHTEGTFVATNFADPRNPTVAPIGTMSDTAGLVFSGAMSSEEMLKKLKTAVPVGSLGEVTDLVNLKCPEMASADEIAKVDWAAEFGVSQTSAGVLKAGITAAHEIAGLATGFTDSVAQVCADFATDLGGAPPKDLAGACKEAASRVVATFAAFKDARVSLQVGPPSCTAQTTLESCLRSCNAGPVACEGQCGLEVAQSIRCQPPTIAVTLPPEIEGALKVQKAIEKHVPRLVRVVVGLAPAAKKAIDGAKRLFGVAQEAIGAAARGGLKTAAKMALCLTGQLKNAIGSVGVIKSAFDAGAELKARVDEIGGGGR